MNLYYTDLKIENSDIFEQICLRSVNMFDVIRTDDIQMIFFCLSENVSVFDIEDDKDVEKFTFSQLAANGIAAEQLFFWSASIDKM